MSGVDIRIRAAAVEDYLNGMSSTEAAERHGVSNSSVLAWARMFGAATRRQGARRRREMVADFEALDRPERKAR